MSAQRNLVKQFQDEYQALVSRYLHDIKEADFRVIEDKISNLEDHIDSLNRAETPRPERIHEQDENPEN